MQELGGADTHSQKSGVCHLEAEDDQARFTMIRELLSYMPSNNVEDPPFVASGDDPARVDASLDSTRSRKSQQALRHERDHPARASTTRTISGSQEGLRAQYVDWVPRGLVASRSGWLRISRRLLAWGGCLDTGLS